MSQGPTIASRTAVLSTPYFRLVAKTLESTTGDPYYALELQDYVTVLAVTSAGDILLVRQYRPAVEDYCLELPSGHVEQGETPLAAAERELLEETGFATDALELLGCLAPDTGRMANRLWCYFTNIARAVPGVAPTEPGVELVICPRADRQRLLGPPLFAHALHLAVLQLALVQGKLALDELVH